MILRRLFVVGLMCAAICQPATLQASATATPIGAMVAYGPLATFATEQAAQAHCPSDTVVWPNTKTGIWHEKGMRWYGRTKEGAYVCRKEAAGAGYRDTQNGQ